MGFSCVFSVIYLFLACDGFLLDDRTNPATTSGSLLIDQHFNFLINLIMTEQQSRSKLKQHVERLEQELLATKQGVTDLYHTSTINNATLEREASSWNTLYAKYNKLDTDHNLLKLNFDKLDLKHSNLENYTKALEHEVASLQQLKGVTELQTILSVRNATKILREELKITYNSLNSVRNEAEARKQDFIALLYKANAIEQKLEFYFKALDNNIYNVSETIQYKQNQTELEVKQIQHEIQTYRYNQSVRFKHFQENLTAVEGIQNVSTGELNLEINTMSNRVCAKDKTYSGGSIILFPFVKTRDGVSDPNMLAFISSGMFKCEKAGLYLISLFLMTDTQGHVEFHLYKNGGIIYAVLSSVTTSSSYQTSSILVLRHLKKNDTILIKAGQDVHVYGSIYSCISFLQLTN
ncbi:Hypothetical predicted protein [Mytilus galloprovincialis]|uniref:C1q domain-containing protein n=1 Tax=Mytilus galloprovincialis TaxID=29158 RepID=A0A8B6CZ13_MYTGA|nr:Hypothetical predicted protein [Mytilus galloprovincialis]